MSVNDHLNFVFVFVPYTSVTLLIGFNCVGFAVAEKCPQFH